MMDACRTFERWLARAADGTLEPLAQVRLDAHLASCADCRAALAAQQAVRGVLASRTPDRARAGFVDRVTAAIEADRSWLSWLDFRAWTWRLVPVAGALSLAAWFVVQSPASSAVTSTTTDATTDADLPVAAALWDPSVSDTSVLSLMLRASANDRLADSYKER